MGQILQLVTESEHCAAWASKISAAWQEGSDFYRKSVQSFVNTGRLLNEAKDALGHGQWLPMLKTLPFNERTAQVLMRIAKSPILANPQNSADLPFALDTLDRLASVPAPDLETAVINKVVTSEMTGKDVALLLPTKRRAKTPPAPKPAVKEPAEVGGFAELPELTPEEEIADLRAHRDELKETVAWRDQQIKELKGKIQSLLDGIRKRKELAGTIFLEQNPDKIAEFLVNELGRRARPAAEAVIEMTRPWTPPADDSDLGSSDHVGRNNTPH